MYNHRQHNITYGADGNLSLIMDKNWGESIVNNNELFTINNLSYRRRNNNFNDSSLENFQDNSNHPPPKYNPMVEQDVNSDTNSNSYSNKLNKLNNMKCGNNKFNSLQLFKCGVDLSQVWSNNYKTENEAAEACQQNALCKGYLKFSIPNTPPITNWFLLIDLDDKECAKQKEMKMEPTKGFCIKR